MTQEELDEAIERLIADSNALTVKENLRYNRVLSAKQGAALARRTYRSTEYLRALEEAETEHKENLRLIQRDLNESLAALKPDSESTGGSGSTDAPYLVDYSLPMRTRYVTVKDYYLAYENKSEAYADLLNDTVAKEYLGDTFYQYLLTTVREYR